MERKRNIQRAVAFILVAAAAPTAGFFIGRAEFDSRFAMELELDIILARSDLEGLGDICEYM
ncbi:MAG: hypothetical protein II705_01980 [Clostridia bacterium]|nr:hypothetical protein [Clostridia bacterium]MBQ1436204.1 hypothetical protein [Clostridia bacterium]MBQ4248788.1 hypothetical protein [Clostridia bacterium]